ncbi:MAG: hypothetical protein QM582_08590 [Micropruina sp.]|uniref:hypothetical protein n=1 Tax=Micropruina sp. TaxID=2737536 RepID=UPI0039E5135B
MTSNRLTSTARLSDVQRQRLLCRDPWLVLGFGVPTFLLLSIPALSLLLFPIATAAGTLLTRRLVAR